MKIILIYNKSLFEFSSFLKCRLVGDFILYWSNVIRMFI